MKYIKLLLTLAALAYFSDSFSQVVVVKDPAWKVEDAIEKAKEFAILEDQLLTSKEHLKHIKDATEKLQKVNRLIRNYRHLEDAISLTANAYQRFGQFIKNIEKDNLFSIEEVRMATTLCMTILSNTAYSMDVLSTVLKDFGFEASDYERLNLLDSHLKTLRSDVNTLYLFIWEIEQLNNNRMQIRTIEYMRYALSGKQSKKPGK